jgi:hypothetical protein
MKVTCVVGLPGSGKTHWAQAQPHSHVCDDPKHVSELPSVDWLIQNNQDLIITDPWFCDGEVRHSCESHIKRLYGVPPDWVFFENDPEQCMMNVLLRQDGRQVRSMIVDLTKRYQIPDRSRVLRVYGVNKD